MILKDFAKERNENPHTIATYIRRHPEEFEGHTEMKGNRLVLDDYALGLLDKVYPLPKPVEIIIDHESRDMLILAQNEISRLKDKMLEMQSQIALAEAAQMLLEDKKVELEVSRADAKGERERADGLLQENVELKLQLEAEKNRKLTVWERLTGRKGDNNG